MLYEVHAFYHLVYCFCILLWIPISRELIEIYNSSIVSGLEYLYLLFFQSFLKPKIHVVIAILFLHLNL